jgi:hypothetical protein
MPQNETGENMKRVYVDENGNIDSVTPEGMKAWLEKYEDMKAHGASEATAKAAANAIQEEIDDICFNGIIDEDE